MGGDGMDLARAAGGDWGVVRFHVAQDIDLNYVTDDGYSRPDSRVRCLRGVSHFAVRHSCRVVPAGSGATRTCSRSSSVRLSASPIHEL